VLRWCGALWRRGGLFIGRGGSGDAVGSRGQVVGDAAPPLAGWHHSMTSATVSSHAYWSGDREAVEAPFPPSIGRGPACSSAGSTAERAGCHRVLPRGLSRTAAASCTVNAIFWIFAHRVFGQMPA
jgi:hypothetical protein